MKIFSNRSGFLKSPLFREVQRWYMRNFDKNGLSFVFNDTELKRGNSIFAYGQRYLKSSDDGRAWASTFPSLEEMKAVITQMR